MAIYRNVHLSFWTDRKVEEEFTPEDKYFYLYLFTNPHTNLCGCYELGIRQAVRETGYNEDTVLRLIKRFEEVHKVIAYSKETSEVLIINWHKYNWTKSADFMKGLFKQIYAVKCTDFRQYLLDLSEGHGTVYRPSTDGRGTSVTVPVINNNINFEDIWQKTFAAYPKKTNYASARSEWMGRILQVIEPNRKDVATMIWKAMKAYLKDYKEKNTDDDNYRFVPAFNKWLTEELDYWLAEIQRRKESEE